MRAIELTKLSGEVKAKSSLSARETIRKAQSFDFQSAGITMAVGTRLALQYRTYRTSVGHMYDT